MCSVSGELQKEMNAAYDRLEKYQIGAGVS